MTTDDMIREIHAELMTQKARREEQERHDEIQKLLRSSTYCRSTEEQQMIRARLAELGYPAVQITGNYDVPATPHPSARISNLQEDEEQSEPDLNQQVQSIIDQARAHFAKTNS